MSAVHDVKKSSPHPKKFRQRRKVKHMDVENSDTSDDEVLQSSGNTRLHEFFDEIEILQQKVNKTHKVLEKLVMSLAMFCNTEEYVVAKKKYLFQSQMNHLKLLSQSQLLSTR